MRSLTVLFCASLALTGPCARASDSVEAGSNPKAAAPAAPQRLATLDFFKHPLIGDAKISPDGRHLALLVPQGEETRLDIVDTATLNSTAAYD